ncbi:MAG: sugar kinase [Candidatus Hydrogenedentota bacterium]
MILTVTPNPCVDKTVFIDRLEPGTFMRSKKCTCIPGGKGVNVSRAVKIMGRATTAMVVVGGHPGRHVVDMIENQDGIECVPAWVESQTRTITTVLEEPIHRQTAFFEPGPRVTETEAQSIVETFRSAVRKASAVVFSGTVSDPAMNWLYRELVPIAKSAGAITVLDSHGDEFALGLESGPYMAKPNVLELEEWVGYKLEDESIYWRAIDAVHAHGVELVVLSLGKDGALVSRAGERFRVVPSPIKEVNPVGSGDALVAGWIIGLLEGMDLADIGRLGCAMGTANAMSWDIGHFTRDDVQRLIRDVTANAVRT